METTNYSRSFVLWMESVMPDGVFGAILIFVIGWIVGYIVKGVVHYLLKKTDWDERLLGNTIIDTNKFLANIAYYIIMIIVLIMVLDKLGATTVLDHIQGMAGDFTAFIPNILASVAYLFIGYVLAKLISNLVKMAGSFLDRVAEKLGYKDTDKLVYFLQQVVFVIIFIPSIIQSLNALELDAITQPANNILHQIFDAVPKIIGATLVIALFFIFGKFVAGFANDMLKNLGADELPKKLHLFVITEKQSLSKVLSNIIYFFIIFFGIVSGVEMLGLDKLSEVFHNILNLSGSILFGMVVMVIGNLISSLIYNAMAGDEDKVFAAGVVRVAIIGLFLAIALRTMGIANSIVELAFGLTLGSIAVTVALAYGLGGREAAGKHMEKILKKFQKD